MKDGRKCRNVDWVQISVHTWTLRSGLSLPTVPLKLRAGADMNLQVKLILLWGALCSPLHLCHIRRLCLHSSCGVLVFWGCDWSRADTVSVSCLRALQVWHLWPLTSGAERMWMDQRVGVRPTSWNLPEARCALDVAVLTWDGRLGLKSFRF